MADEPEPMSVKDRIAALKLNQVGRVPGQQQPPSSQANNGTNATTKRPPPPPPPARPNVPARPQSTNVPTAQHHPPSTNGIANQPEVERPTAGSNSNGTNGLSRPSLPPRTSTQERRNGPSLPPRAPSGPSPALPPRRPSETPSNSDHALSRKPSSESVSSTATGRSSLSGVSNTTSGTSRSERFAIRAPSFDPSTLPPLPPRQTEEQKAAYFATPKPQSKGRWGLKSTNSSPNIQAQHNGTTPPPSRRPSAQPQPVQGLRRESIAEEEPQQAHPPPQTQQRQIVPPPPQRPKKSALEMGFGNKPTTSNADPSPPVPNTRPVPSQPSDPGIPPPVPKASRPDLAALQASKPKLHNPSPASTTGSSTCLHCRDFTAADTHAARFPLHSLPTKDLTHLAHQLTSPFPSSPTDQARALFTWLHHNIAYDTQAFFSGNLRPSSPQSTLESGLAVCEGYAGLFTALALKAGLESYVISGHGKGFGFSQLSPHDPLPAYNAGHAWNAVRLPDSPASGPGGGWKLIDACWGAGHICGNNNLFKKEFAPERFTQSNESFGLDHFPGDPKQQLRADGTTVGWEDYIRQGKKGCQAKFFAGFTSAEGVDEGSFFPRENPVRVSDPLLQGGGGGGSGGMVRFSFQQVCPHWDPLRNGRGPFYLYALQLPGEGKKMLPFESKGGVWWCDVPRQDLLAQPSSGTGSSEVKVLAITSFRGGDGRGVSAGMFREWQGRCAMGWGYVAKWDVVA
ncbi:hypothetical protein KC333_g8850 [Hortaea werneckii]|nr:hypothetical protein KC333_g8850 [Hortaea werneckii]KAI7315792.1 hypothetical protein KC326_g4602 [Hortaea werneckii]